jgi:hypothetical protein
MTEARPLAGGAAGDASFGRTLLALFAGWLVPGAGHAILGRVRRAGLFFLLIMGSFGIGLAEDGRLALYSPRDGFLTGLQLVANIGVGPADALARIKVYGKAAYRLPDQSDPSHKPLIETFRERQRSAVSAYGTAFLWSAGLMNLLLLLDVWDIAKRRKD